MRVVAIVQARLGSSRLPGKALLTLGGRPLIAHVLERARAIAGVSEVILATSENYRDQSLVQAAVAQGIRSFCGSEWDVLGRMRAAAEWARADAVMRLTGDCPFLDPAICDEVLSAFHATSPDYIWNDTHRSGFPDGLDAEVFTREALELAATQAIDRGDREHVTPWMRRELRCGVVVCADGDHSALKLSVDTREDFERAQAIARALPLGDFSLRATLAAYGQAHG